MRALIITVSLYNVMYTGLPVPLVTDLYPEFQIQNFKSRLLSPGYVETPDKFDMIYLLFYFLFIFLTFFQIYVALALCPEFDVVFHRVQTETFCVFCLLPAGDNIIRTVSYRSLPPKIDSVRPWHCGTVKSVPVLCVYICVFSGHVRSLTHKTWPEVNFRKLGSSLFDDAVSNLYSNNNRTRRYYCCVPTITNWRKKRSWPDWKYSTILKFA